MLCGVDRTDMESLRNWALIEPLTEGHFTASYRAKPLGDLEHADYVVKRPRDDRDPTGIRLIQREAFVGSVAASANLTTVLHSHVESPPFFIVLPFHEGLDLQERLASSKPIPLAKALWIARQLVEGVSSLHARGWIHRDIKPANIIVSPQLHTTLIDFGLATSAKTYLSEEIACTPRYSAPEHFCSRHPPEPSSDIYSIGIVLYEMLTGRVPFEDDGAPELISAHIHQPPPDPRDFVATLPHRVVRLVRAMLAKQPLRRPVGDELLQWLMELEIEFFEERFEEMRLAG